MTTLNKHLIENINSKLVIEYLVIPSMFRAFLLVFDQIELGLYKIHLVQSRRTYDIPISAKANIRK